MKRRTFLATVIVAVLATSFGCSGQNRNSVSRAAQDAPLPYFNAVIWPPPNTVLTEGRLVITGNLQCPAGYFEEMPMSVYMYPVSFINPPLPAVANSHQVTQQQLQQILAANGSIQGLINETRAVLLRRVTEGPFVGAEKWQDFTQGLQSRGIFSHDFDQHNYVDFQTGNFRIDFSETARLTPGDTLLMVEGVDQDGIICIAMNIFSISDLIPGNPSAEDVSAIAYSGRIVGLGNALIQVLGVSGDNRGNDIALIHPFLDFVMGAYGQGFYEWNWDTAAANLRQASIAPAALLTDPAYKAIYEGVVSYIAEEYEFRNYLYWSNHFVDIPPGTDLVQKHQEADQYLISQFTEFNEQYIITDRGGGVKELTVWINQGMNLVAQFSVIADPNSPLVVMGFIGQHTIVPADYNPYFLEIFDVFESEHIAWPPVGI